MESYKGYSSEDVIKYAKESNNMRQLLGKLGLKSAGGNYESIKKKLQKLKVDCDHWTGKSWSKGQRLKNWSDYARSKQIKIHLIHDRGHQCESCLLTTWLGQPITLELDHIDGDKTNNCIENFALLCCNCHSLTPTWKNKKRQLDENQSINVKPRKIKNWLTCKNCTNIISKNNTGLCKPCFYKSRRKVLNRPSYEDLIEEIKNSSVLSVGKKYNVSDNCIRKWLIQYEIIMQKKEDI